MKSCSKLLVRSIICVIILLVFPKTVEANNVFYDDFIEYNQVNWSYIPNDASSVTTDNNVLTLKQVDSHVFPYLTKSFPNDGVGEMSVKFKFSGHPNYGAGIVVSDSLLPNNINFPVRSSDVMFMIWPKPNTGFVIDTVLCSEDNINCIEGKNNSSIFNGLSNEWYVVKITKKDAIYSLYVNGTQIFESKITNKKMLHFWLGNPENTGGVVWPEIQIDYISATNSVIPTILIPGLGASWDIGAMLIGSEKGNWEIPEFIKVYDGLENSFLNAGYMDSGIEKNLFTFSYDWRKPLDLLAGRLNTYIEENIPNGEKVNLVGHSMGGLVARAYAQNFGNLRINKIVTVGSPNLGTVLAYGPWEGATVFDNSWWSKLALELTTHFGFFTGESNIDTLHRLSPSLKDLLPTYDFLSLNDVMLPWITMNQKNNYLNGLNQNITSTDPITTAIYSSDIQTNSQIKVRSHEIDDLDSWIDGKPINNPFSTSNGDGTVIKTSAIGPFTSSLQGSGWHGELVTKKENIEKIFDVLGLDASKALSGVDDSQKNVFVAILKSPGDLEVCDLAKAKCNEELGIVELSNKLFLLPGYNNENLILKVKENGTGSYQLHLGNINDLSSWTVIDGSLDKLGEIDEYDITSDGHILTATTPDNIPPSSPVVIGFVNPTLSCGSVTNLHTITVDWTDAMDQGGLAGYEYNIDYPLGNSRGVWNTFMENSQYSGALNEGVHHIKVRARDTTGNFSDWSNVCSITADWTAPTISITSPLPGIYKPEALPKLKYLVNDDFDPNPIINTSGWSKTTGTHTVVVIATDKAGNVNSNSITYTVQKTNPQPNFCKKNGWMKFWFWRFRNQGDCMSYVNRHEREILRFYNLFKWIYR